MLKLYEGDIDDLATERSFRDLLKYLNANPFVTGEWRHMEISISGAQTNYKVEHKLGFLPKDVFLTYQSASGLTINYANITADYLDFTTTGSVTFRLIVGRYQEE